MSRFPFPIPSGWFMLRYSDEVEPGDVEPLFYFGRDLVLFRTESGSPRVLDAFCPHLGAHLGHGGRVEGETLACPFHGWRFDEAGKCESIPYSDRVPRGARSHSWPVVEQAGRIWIWHGARGEAPFYDLPRGPLSAFEETEERRESWSLGTCLQEMSENGSDAAHFRFIHGMQAVPDLGLHFDGARVSSMTPTRLPTPDGSAAATIEVESIGMGCDVIRYSGACDLVEVVCATPIDRERCEVRMSYVFRSRETQERRSIAHGMADYLIAQFEKDVPIWENKVYRPTPPLCEGDGPITAFRRWCRQFYPDSAGGKTASH